MPPSSMFEMSIGESMAYLHWVGHVRNCNAKRLCIFCLLEWDALQSRFHDERGLLETSLSV